MLRNRRKDIESWFKQSRKKPLILRGARQVGKSTLVRDFTSNNGVVLHEVNLERHAQLKEAILSNNTKDFLQGVQLICNKGRLDTSNSLLFIDEIQAIPEALQFLRYLSEDNPDLAIICAGSLLEFVLTSDSSNFSMPVGRVEYLFLGPCTFKEFLEGANEKQLLEYITSYRIGETFSDVAHQKLLSLLKTYQLVGGMPEALQKYLDTNDLLQVSRVHASIMSTYRDDFSKYSRKVTLLNLQKIIDYLPIGLGQKIKYSNIDQLLKSAELKTAIGLLEMAGLLPLAYASNATKPPLASSKNIRTYKAYFLDCGLLNCIAGLQLDRQAILMNEDDLSEQFIAQHLMYLGEFYERPSLYYWLREGRSNNAEVDFLFQHNTKILPVEVKSGSSGKLKSIHQFLARDVLALDDHKLALRFNTDRPSIEEAECLLTTAEKKKIKFKLITLPIYLVEETTRLIS